MENLNLEVIIGLIGAGILGPTAWKLVPVVTEWVKDRNTRSGKLTDTAFKASGMSLESLMIVVEKYGQMVDKLEERIEANQDDYREDFASLKKQYEEQIDVLVQRHKQRSDEMLKEIRGLKGELRKYQNMKEAVEDQ